MPPLPKRKYPKSRQGKRRSHLAMRMPHIVECPNCQSPRLAHRACPICGTYRGREVMAVESDDTEI
ncbi:MAG: 50S ribosomal protein L32 [Dehalococcoidia bacterium]